MRFDLREESKEHVIVTAHRGVCGGNIPCNTLDAFRAALYQKADMIELDVGRSRDGTLYVFHEGREKAHLNCDQPLGTMTDEDINGLRYVNTDGKTTNNNVNKLDEVLEFLKGKCYINIDKFTLYPTDIVHTIRRHNMMEQVVVKSPAEKMQLDVIEELSPEIPYIVIIKEQDCVSDIILQHRVNFIGIETVFKSENSPVAADEYRERVHKKGLLLWGNGIVYNYKSILSAGHSDDVSVTGNPDEGWGWLARKGFDILQTDWPMQMKNYLKENQLYFRRKG